MKSLISGPSISDQQARFASPELTAFREFFEIKSKALAEKIMSDLDEQERALAAEQKARIESGLIDPAKYQEFVRLAQQVRHRREMSLELPHGFAGPKPPVGFQFLNTALVWPYTLVGDPVESHFMGMIAGNGPHHQLDSWGEAYGSYQDVGMSRVGFLNNIPAQKIPINRLHSITEVTDWYQFENIPTAMKDIPCVDSPSSRGALVIGYMVFRIPHTYFGGTLSAISVAPMVSIGNMDVWVDKPVFFEETTEAHFEISTFMYQQLNQFQEQSLGGSGATKVFVDVHSPKVPYSTTLQTYGICNDLGLSAAIDSNKDVYFGVMIYHWVASVSVGGHLDAYIENMFGDWGWIEVPCLGLNTQVLMATHGGSIKGHFA